MGFGIGMRYRRWTAQECATLRRLADERVTTRAIARVLRRSPMAVRLKAWRLGVAVRSPVGRPRLRRIGLPVAQHCARVVGSALDAAKVQAFLTAEAALDHLLMGSTRATQRGGCLTRRRGAHPFREVAA